uniref:NADH dehydrogenase subunit 2 n=1 Tax=Lepidotrigona flavibasis TaxID=2696055 RepID=A0A6B9N0C3_9HYME|nr:NADH dehydrogenase subunit 2 [Lepidotrigona flavibasis]
MFMIKLSMFPFHNWMIYCYEKSSWEQIFLMSSIMKFIPTSFFCHFLDLWKVMVLVMVFNSIFMSLYVSFNFSFKKVLACSTSFNNFLMTYIFMLNIKQFMIFAVMYSIVIFSVTYLVSKFGCSKNFIIFQSSNLYYLFKIWVLIYSMIPMMVSFLLKWNFIYEMMKFSSSMCFIYLIFLLSNFLMIWKYMVLMKKSMMMKSPFTMKKMGEGPGVTMILVTLLFMFMFVTFNFISN